MRVTNAKTYVHLYVPMREWQDFTANLKFQLVTHSFRQVTTKLFVDLWFKPSRFSGIRPLIPGLYRHHAPRARCR